MLNVEIVAIQILHFNCIEQCNFIRSTIAIILYFNEVATSHLYVASLFYLHAQLVHI